MNRNSVWILCWGVLLAGVALLALSPANRASAQPSGATDSPAATAASRVAVVDFVRIFDECAQIKDLNDLIRQKQEALKAEAEQRRDVIENKQMEFAALRVGSLDYETRRKDLLRLRMEANVWLQMSEQDLDKQKFDWTRIIYEDALKAAADVAKANGHDIILQKKEFDPDNIEPTVANIRRVIQDRSVVYSAPELDVTTPVIRRLDASYATRGGKSQLSPEGKPAAGTP